MKTAIVLGATGLTGGLLLDKLVKDDNYKIIKVFTRRTTGNKSPKVKEFIIDLLLLDQFTTDFIADEVFCCIGTTAKKTKDKTVYKSIDYGIPVTAAKLAKANGIEVFTVVSAMGANLKSSVFYNKTKGEMEASVLEQKIKHTYILRPSLIKGNRQESRLGEDIGNFIANFMNLFLIGSLRKYRSIKGETIATALKNIVVLKPAETIIFSNKIKEISKL
ncbi:nucleoside-diphosphate sugar epimerase [Tenacibaculum sp. Bg11-29]|uniref:NAD(P)H-binding protein n=1 Tax=Tenacibaculum sp. Bg11-29 TaxID=2058306 RepID=UPI000C34D2C5|nr:NAD(P)H-binding protein [Tenacibaculum sp. Bg11-29]PKH51102.1 nucleoside-diphosphate sugar epimerase [Tenacibaculum sp. Bg11-29]